MTKYLRTFIALIVILSLVLLARNEAAGAANATADSQQAALQPPNVSLLAPNEDDDDGTVVPPENDIRVCEEGNYSVGGVAVLDVRKLQDRSDKRDCFRARTHSSENVKLPKNAGPVISDVVQVSSVGRGSIIRICFAAPPGTQVRIFYSDGDSYKPVGTQVRNGIACATVNKSGRYVLGGK